MLGARCWLNACRQDANFSTKASISCHSDNIKNKFLDGSFDQSHSKNAETFVICIKHTWRGAKHFQSILSTCKTFPAFWRQNVEQYRNIFTAHFWINRVGSMKTRQKKANIFYVAFPFSGTSLDGNFDRTHLNRRETFEHQQHFSKHFDRPNPIHLDSIEQSALNALATIRSRGRHV